MEEICIVPRSLMSMLSLIYNEACDKLILHPRPRDSLLQLLQPYYVTYDQLNYLISKIHWPGRLSANVKHPFYAIVQQLERYKSNDMYANKDILKKHYCFAATSICHIWYSRLNEEKNGYILHKTPHFVSYQFVDSPIPFVWISVDTHGMPHIFGSHHDMPCLEIDIIRCTKLGDLRPLTLSFFESSTTGTSHIRLQLFEQSFLGISTFQSFSYETPNYVLLLSEDLLFSRCIMISPSSDKSWSIPVIFHQYE